jgi:hypothetical protein
MEDGLTKKVTETYVVNADSFTEAEKCIIREMKQYISGEFDVAEIDRAVFREVLFMGRDELEQKKDADVHWYKCKVQFITIDERSGKEKKTSVHLLVEGCGIENAKKNIDKQMSSTMADYHIAAVSETSIIDVFGFLK